MAMFKLHDFVMTTLKGMKEVYSEFQVREYALKWYDKRVLTDEDILFISEWYSMPESEDTNKV